MEIGVVIARMHVPELHRGHVQLLIHVKHRSDRLVVLLGVSPTDGHTAENPLTYGQRESMVRSTFHSATILPLLDRHDNAVWSTKLDELLSSLYPHDTVTLYYGAHPSFEKAYRGKFRTEPVDVSVPNVSGTRVRESIEETATSHFFLQGQIFALQRQYPQTFPTVDVALVKGDEVLLIQRADTGLWCLPGGFVDPTDSCLEAAARRELMEETQMGVEGIGSYVASMLVDDWRYRKCRDKIMTSLFMFPYSYGKPHCNPDEVRDWQWYNFVGRSPVTTVAEAHQPLIVALKYFLSKDSNATT